MAKRVNVQNVFNKVIDAGIYGEDNYSQHTFMCTALRTAARRGIITDSEFNAAKSAIDVYLKSFSDFKAEWAACCMCNALSFIGRSELLDCNQGLPKEEHTERGEACTTLYRNWYRRPKITAKISVDRVG